MTQIQHNQLVSFIWNIANDVLVNVYNKGDYRKVILPMIVLRRFDAVLEDTKKEVLAMKERLTAANIIQQDEALCAVAGQAFCNSSPFTLKDLKSRTNSQQLKLDFIAYLDGFSANVQDIITKFKFRNEIDTLVEGGVLGLLIEKFVDNRINLSNRPVLFDDGSVRLPALDNHSIGTVFEELLRRFNEEKAHSSQTGSLFAKMNMAVSGNVCDDEEDIEDKINKLIEGHRMVRNANYYAFTATPKNKTLEMFGDAIPQPDGQVRHVAFHTYSMRQAIQERFILDVLEHYTPVSSFYKLVKKSEDDPLFDNEKAQAKLRAYVEGDRTTIHHKAAIMVEHFHTNVISKGKIGGQARAMVVTSSIERAIDYYFEFCRLLEERGSQYKAIIAFSGEKELPNKYKEYGKMTEASLNGFPSAEIEDRFKKDPYRFLIVANKFQTGYDEPLLHTMYVDKILTDIKAVQTLSRLNRAHPKKRDTFVLDFANDPEDIKKSFQRYYKTTELASETDPNKLNDLITELEKHQVYTAEDVERLVGLFLGASDREMIDSILDTCAENYKTLNTDSQVKFKSSAKSFIRTYAFLAAILPFGSAEWEKLSIFLNLLIHKLPTPEGDDYTEGLLDAVDFNSYKNTIQEEQRIILDNEKAEVQAIPVGRSGGITSPNLQSLTTILEEFNTRFGNIPWTDSDRIRQQIAAIPEEVAKNEAYQNAIRNSDREVARIESDKALMSIILRSMTSGLELYKEYQDNPSFQRWLQEFVFERTYNQNR